MGPGGSLRRTPVFSAAGRVNALPMRERNDSSFSAICGLADMELNTRCSSCSGVKSCTKRPQTHLARDAGRAWRGEGLWRILSISQFP